jgi:transposase-like protein
MEANKKVESAGYWQSHVEKQKESGQSIAGYCRANNISEASLYKWRQRLRKKLAQPGFAEVIKAPPMPAPAAQFPISGIRVRVTEFEISRIEDLRSVLMVRN